MAKTKTENKIKVDSHTIEISNASKILFPEDKFTKGDIVEYYREIGKIMVPHVKGRPVTMHRYPNGLFGEGFIQKDAPDYYPTWVKREYVKRKNGGKIDHVVCDNTATIVYLANQACITFHIWLSTVESPELPDRIIFDLDPSVDDFETVRFAAHEFRKFLAEELELPLFIMTTGSRGLHVVLPVEPKFEHDHVREIARGITNIVVGRNSSKLTSEVRKNKRDGRLFVDIARNAYGQTTVAPYSVRAKKGAPVAVPLDWDEIDDKKLSSDKYTIKNVMKRIRDVGDPWHDIGKKAVTFASIEKKLSKLKVKSKA